MGRSMADTNYTICAWQLFSVNNDLFYQNKAAILCDVSELCLDCDEICICNCNHELLRL